MQNRELTSLQDWVTGMGLLQYIPCYDDFIWAICLATMGRLPASYRVVTLLSAE